MGLLGSLFGFRSRGMFGGGMGSPLTMALLALLVSRGLGGKQNSSTTGASPEGSLLGGGLGALIEQFKKSGYGDIIRSWIGPGQNQPIAPDQLSTALGDDTVNTLSKQTGMPKSGILGELSTLLPDLVNKVTPEGRVPLEAEMNENIKTAMNRDVA